MITTKSGNIHLSRNGSHIHKPVTMGSGGKLTFPYRPHHTTTTKYSNKKEKEKEKLDTLTKFNQRHQGEIRHHTKK